MSHPAQIAPDQLWPEMFGHDEITLSVVSLRTGDRKTFQVERVPGKDGKPAPLMWWVRQLTGPDNRLSFTYLVTAYGQDGGYIRLGLTAKSPEAGWDHAAVKAFLWLFKGADGQHGDLGRAEVWRACPCQRCGKLLTVPKSIKQGRGPYCVTQP